MDTVGFPAERNASLPVLHDVAESSAGGCVVCYSGLFRGFGGKRSGALRNHIDFLLEPLAEIFPEQLFIAFSTALDSSQGKEDSNVTLSADVYDLLPVRLQHTIEAPRPVVNGSNYMQFLSFGGIEHCGRLIEALAARRGRPFLYAVRMRYDFIIEPTVAGSLLKAWPIWQRSASPILAFTKYINDNSTSTTRGLQLSGCPWQLPTRRCVPQDVFVVLRACASLGPVEAFFLTPHTRVRWWLTEGLKSRQHTSERTLFHLPLSLGLPIDMLWLQGGHCAWMLVDDRSQGDNRAPRAIFRFRCTRLRANATVGPVVTNLVAVGSGTAADILSSVRSDSNQAVSPQAVHRGGNAETDRGERLAVREWHLSHGARAAKEVACARERNGSTRIAWLHIPKCGSSFGTTLLHTANSSLPPAAKMPSCTHNGILLVPELPSALQSQRGRKCLLSQPEFTFFSRFPVDDWFKCIFWEKSRGNFGGHEPIDDLAYRSFAPRFYGMFRAPLRRVVSSYLWYSSEFHHSEDAALPNATAYAIRARGTQVKMVAGQSDGESCNSGFKYWSRCDTSIVPDVDLAIRRMTDGFAFVGLTDQWALSICLFHAKFGGSCLSVEFENSRPTNPRLTRLPWIRNITLEKMHRKVMEEMATVYDPYDAPLYEAVKARFYSEVREHALSPQRCQALCPTAPIGAFRDAAFGGSSALS